jgi:hypothetical protein
LSKAPRSPSQPPSHIEPSRRLVYSRATAPLTIFSRTCGFSRRRSRSCMPCQFAHPRLRRRFKRTRQLAANPISHGFLSISKAIVRDARMPPLAPRPIHVDSFDNSRSAKDTRPPHRSRSSPPHPRKTRGHERANAVATTANNATPPSIPIHSTGSHLPTLVQWTAISAADQDQACLLSNPVSYLARSATSPW